MSQYLTFVRHLPPGRATSITNVESKSSGALLGQIRWHGPWRQYCFMPEPRTIFNVGCMADIEHQIGELMAERRVA